MERLNDDCSWDDPLSDVSRIRHLILDLDHTLISSFEFGESPVRKPDGFNTVSPILIDEYIDELGSPQMYHAAISNVVVLIKLRPFVRSFIRSVANSGMCIHVYTKGRRAYMQEVLRIIDPDTLIRGARVSRDDEPHHLKDNQKDISLIREGYPAHIHSAIVLDDSPSVWSCSASNFRIELIAAKRHSFSETFVEFLRCTQNEGVSRDSPGYPRDNDEYLSDLFVTCIRKILGREQLISVPASSLSSVTEANSSAPRQKHETYTPSNTCIEEKKTLGAPKTNQTSRAPGNKVWTLLNKSVGIETVVFTHNLKLMTEAAAGMRKRLIAHSIQAVQAVGCPSSDSSSESDEALESRRKPVFVPKTQRGTAFSDAVIEKDAYDFISKLRQGALQRALVEDLPALRSACVDKLKPPPRIGAEDTDDAYQAWRLRELKRTLQLKQAK